MEAIKQILRSLPQQLKSVTKKGFFHILISNTLVNIIAFLSSSLVVKVLSKQEFGVLGFVDNIVGYILLFNAIGMANSVLRYCSMTDDLARKEAILRFCIKMGIVIDLVLVAISLPIILFVPMKDFENARGVLIFASFIPLAHFLFTCFSYYLRSNFLNKEFSKVSVLFTLTTAVTQLLLALKLRVFGSISGKYVAYIAAIALAMWIISRHLSKDTQGKRLKPPTLDLKEKRAMIIFAIGSLAGSSFSLIMPLNEQIVVTNVLGSRILTANYKAASILPQSIQFITSSVMIFIYPYFARNSFNGKWIWKHFKLLTYAMSALMILISIIGVIATPFLIHVMFKDSYKDITGLMRFMWVVFGINAAIRMPAGNILGAIGEIKFNLIVSIASCVVHLGLDLFFISYLGINGAVYALTITYIASGLLNIIYLYKKAKDKEKVIPAL
ncbi:MAG: oligosaccharide flippase family protein [Oscillospiraceae bacterium]|jgi:O-antigen/teichoic acid export membrane protein|nr:oligosaccharide flippase family protein [Oscillospiraceae bacterium]